MVNLHPASTRAVLAALLVALPMASVRIANGEQQESLARKLPGGAIAYAEVTGLDGVVERVKNSQYLDLLTGSTFFQDATNSPQYRKARAAATIAHRLLGTDVITLSQQLLGHKVAAGIYPAAEKDEPDILVTAVVRQAKFLNRLREQVDPFVLLAEDQIEVSETAGGVEVIRLDNGAIIALGKDWITVTNSAKLFQRLRQHWNDSQSSSLADDENYRLMFQQMGGDHVLSAYVNTGLLKEKLGRDLLPKKLDNGLISLLLGGIFELVNHSPYVGLTLDLEDKSVDLKASVQGTSENLAKSYGAFFSDPEGPGTTAIPTPSGTIAGLAIHRKVAQWYQQREDFLEENVLPGFDKFETGLANILPGRDFGQDVLPLIGDQLSFVAAIQDYSHLDGEPGIKLPGFGVVVELADPKEASDLFQLFFQTLSAILNIEAGQQGRQPWVMSSETYDGTQIAFGRYLKKPSGDRLPIVFNFLPASARVEDKYVVCSSLGLCRQLVGALRSESDAAHTDETKPTENKNFHLNLKAEALGDILNLNQDFFHAQIVQSGKTRKQAANQFKTLIQLLRLFESADLYTSGKTKTFQVHAKVSWK